MPYPDQPPDAPIPSEIDRWNWGAFALAPLWGLFNRAPVALWALVPPLTLVLPFVLGRHGSRWAWRNNTWKDARHFAETQRGWAVAGLSVWVLIPVAAAGLLYLILYFDAGFRNTDAYRQTMARVRADARVIATLGEPVETQWMMAAHIGLSGADGSASFRIPVVGPACGGLVVSESKRRAGDWQVTLLVVWSDCRDDPAVLVNRDNLPVPRRSLLIPDRDWN